MAALPPAVSFPWPEKKQKGPKTAGTVLIVCPGEEFQIRKKEFFVTGPNGTVPMAGIHLHSNEVIPCKCKSILH